MSEQEFPSLGSLSLQPIEELEHPLMSKDRWHGEKDLGMRVNKHLTNSTIYFGNISQDWIKIKAKKFILYSRTQGRAFGTLGRYVHDKSSQKSKPSQIIVRKRKIKPFNFEDDTWDIRSLRPIEVNQKVIIIYFDNISYDWLKTIVKQYIKQSLLSNNAVSSAIQKAYNLRPFCSYIENQTNIQNIKQINRELIIDF